MKGKSLVHKELIKLILESLYKPAEIAVVQIKGHQKADTFEVRGNQLADQMAKKAALDPEGLIKILRLEETSGQGEGEGRPTFSEKEMREIRELGLHQGEHREWLTSDGRKFLHKALAQRVLTEIH